MKVCVYCSSKNSISPMMIEEAKRLGLALGAGGYELVYGGANQGAMGAVANGALEAKARVTGVFPSSELTGEIEHKGLSELVKASDMSDRKRKMIDLSDAFIIFPGGTGTLDEFFEVLVLKQLGASQKPIVVFNLFNFWDPMLEMMQIYQGQGFIDNNVSGFYQVADTVEQVVETLEKHQ